jgi:hypothetical protein
MLAQETRDEYWVTRQLKNSITLFGTETAMASILTCIDGLCHHEPFQVTRIFSESLMNLLNNSCPLKCTALLCDGDDHFCSRGFLVFVSELDGDVLVASDLHKNSSLEKIHCNHSVPAY